jgi:hypothetical protein
MLELWRPPDDAGDAIGCLTSTYTFSPELFDEQCLGRFLAIDSDPDREDLAFLLERESRLDGVYAGVLVDHTQAGVQHSLRWDVLPVRVPMAKQHAKLTLLVWEKYVRIVVASANLSQAGYRSNFEVAGTVELVHEAADRAALGDAVGFLRRLIDLVPGSHGELKAADRAKTFLRRVERLVAAWKRSTARSSMRQHLVFSDTTQSALAESVARCRKRGQAPNIVRIASPFFDEAATTAVLVDRVAASMARGTKREITFAVPAIRLERGASPRLAAPRSLYERAKRRGLLVEVEALPQESAGERRAWHAKLFAMEARDYVALMVGSSNFTSTGLGTRPKPNTEANLLTIIDRRGRKGAASQLRDIWPQCTAVHRPSAAEWAGSMPMLEEEEEAPSSALPMGFISATYESRQPRGFQFCFDPARLPPDWTITSLGSVEVAMLDAASWCRRGSPAEAEVAWPHAHEPQGLRVVWPAGAAIWPFNVDEVASLPPPADLAEMSVDEMLRALSASDPGAALRAWARRRRTTNRFEEELDSARASDLDALRAHDIEKTFLHRVRRRARVLQQLRMRVEQPVHSQRALDARLRGVLSVRTVAERWLQEFAAGREPREELLLAIADFLIALSEVVYKSAPGALTRARFDAMYHPFMAELAEMLDNGVAVRGAEINPELLRFWKNAVKKCRA